MARTPKPATEPVAGSYRPVHAFDNRVVLRHIREGYVSRAEYDAWLAKLEDCEGKYDMVDPLSDGEISAARRRIRVDPRDTVDEE